MSYTREQLQALLELQQQDMRIERDRRTLAEAQGGAELIPLRERLAGAESRAASLAESAGAMRRSLRYAEQEIQALRTETDTNERKLYGGLVRNPKEADKMQQHVAGLRRRVDQDEEKTLALMMEIETLDPEVTAARDEAVSLGADLRRAEEQLAQAVASLTSGLPLLEARRKEIAAGLPPALHSAYEGLRSRRGVGVVAAVRDSKCEGCRVGLPFVKVREVRSGELRTCDNCGRILVEPLAVEAVS